MTLNLGMPIFIPTQCSYSHNQWGLVELLTEPMFYKEPHSVYLLTGSPMV